MLELGLYTTKTPIPYPEGDGLYVWDEENQTWIENN